MSQRDVLLRMFQAAVDAAAPALCVPPHLPAPPAGRTVAVGAGKAAAAMAQAVEAAWPADRPLSGLVVTRYGHGVGPLPRIQVVEAAHPVPDAAGHRAAAAIMQAVAGLGPDDLALCLVSGGASALLALPAAGVDLADKQAVNRALLRSGAGIHEMNCVRKHLSAIKGGRLAAAAGRGGAEVVTLLISDVPGDDPDVIGSGPTVPDATTLADARSVLARHGIAPPPAVAPKKTAKLSFKDAHRLKELEALIDALPATIAIHDATLADPGLYARDSKAFDAAMKAAEKARADLESAELEWLELEEKTEALAG